MLIKTGATPPSPVTPRYPHKLHFICFLFTVSLLIKSVIACLRGHGPHFPTQCDLRVCVHGCDIGLCACGGCISVSCRTHIYRTAHLERGSPLCWQPEGLPSFSGRKTKGPVIGRHPGRLTRQMALCETSGGLTSFFLTKKNRKCSTH